MSAARVDSLGRAASHAAAEALGGSGEDSEAWRGQRKHFFVLTNAGAWPLLPSHLARAISMVQLAGCCHTSRGLHQAARLRTLVHPSALCAAASNKAMPTLASRHIASEELAVTHWRLHAYRTGRPVFTAHGSEHALAGFMAVIDALASFVKDRGDALRSMRCRFGSQPKLTEIGMSPTLTLT